MARKRARENESDHPTSEARKRRRSASNEKHAQQDPTSVNGFHESTNPTATTREQASQARRTGLGSQNITSLPVEAAKPNGSIASRHGTFATNEAKSDSDDDAPEAITSSTAQETVRETSSKITKALSSRRAEEKASRRIRDAWLKAQAKDSTRPRKTTRNKSSEANLLASENNEMTHQPEAQDPAANRSAGDLDDIPDLPAHLLEGADNEAEPLTPTPSPPPPPLSSRHRADANFSSDQTRQLHDESIQDSKRKRLRRHTSPEIEDRHVGPVKVSVLREESKLLAPKGNGKDRSLRQSWLEGRRGRGGRTVTQRMAVNTGFVTSR